MFWVPDISREVDIKNKPRKLTDQEIDIILSTLPDASSFDRELNIQAITDIKRNLKEQIKKSKLVPTDEAKEKLTEIIVRLFLRAVIYTGSPVGLWAGPGLIAPLIQAGMNSFHFSGAGSNTQSVLTFITKLFKAEVPKNPQISVYFKDKTISGQKILDLKPKIIHTTMFDIVTSFEIISLEEANTESQWREDYLNIFSLSDQSVYRSSQVLRIKLDKLKIFRMKLTTTGIKNILETFDTQVKVVPSPLKLGLLDVHLDIVGPIWKVGSKLKKLLDRFGEITLQGLPGIKDLNIVEMPVLSVFDKEKETKGNPDGWRINLNTYRMEKNGISKENVVKLLQDADINVKEENLDYFIVQVPLTNTDLEKLIQEKYLAKTLVYDSISSIDRFESKTGQGLWKISLDKTRSLEYPEIEDFFLKLNSKIVNKIENNKEIILTIQTPQDYSKPSDLIREKIKRASQLARDDLKSELDPILSSKGFYRGIIFGGNLDDVLDLPFVDDTRTISNNMHEIITVFGVEAARDFFVKTLSEFIYSTSVSLHPSYISFVADFSMFTGNYLGATVRHIEKYGAGPLSRGAFGYINDVIGESGFGASESTKNVGAAVLLAQTLPIGTALGVGRYDITTPTEQEEKRRLKEIELKVQKTRKRRTRRKNLLRPTLDLGKKTDVLAEKLKRVPKRMVEEPEIPTATIRSRVIVSPALVSLGQDEIQEQEDELSDLSDFD